MSSTVLQATRDPNSSTEDKFLKFLYQNKLKLPDEAQPKVDLMYVRPDFYYKPNVYIFSVMELHMMKTMLK